MQYDPDDNDQPKSVLRYGTPTKVGIENWTNDVIAMFYTLLAAQKQIAAIKAGWEHYCETADRHYGDSSQLELALNLGEES